MGRIVTGLLVLGVIAGAGWFFFVADKSEREQAKRKGMSAAYDAKFLAKSVADLAPKAPGPSSNSPEAAKQCRDNIRNIEMAKRAVAQELGIGSGGEVPLDKVLAKMGLSEVPKCPAGGKYSRLKSGFLVKCSIGVNTLNDSEDDHVIRDF